MNVNERLFSKSSDALRRQIAKLAADVPSFIATRSFCRVFAGTNVVSRSLRL